MEELVPKSLQSFDLQYVSKPENLMASGSSLSRSDPENSRAYASAMQALQEKVRRLQRENECLLEELAKSGSKVQKNQGVYEQQIRNQIKQVQLREKALEERNRELEQDNFTLMQYKRTLEGRLGIKENQIEFREKEARRNEEILVIDKENMVMRIESLKRKIQESSIESKKLEKEALRLRAKGKNLQEQKSLMLYGEENSSMEIRRYSNQFQKERMARPRSKLSKIEEKYQRNYKKAKSKTQNRIGELSERSPRNFSSGQKRLKKKSSSQKKFLRRGFQARGVKKSPKSYSTLIKNFPKQISTLTSYSKDSKNNRHIGAHLGQDLYHVDLRREQENIDHSIKAFEKELESLTSQYKILFAKKKSETQGLVCIKKQLSQLTSLIQLKLKKLEALKRKKGRISMRALH